MNSASLLTDGWQTGSRQRWLAALLAAVALVCQAGCSRMFWRSQADFDTYNLLLEKTQDPRWDLPRVTVEADPRSRFYDPFNPDLTPLPPDDPAAHRYMHWVDGMKGYKSWHKVGDSMTVENPQWLANFGLAPVVKAAWEDPEGTASGVTTADGTQPVAPTINNLNLLQALELANIHSREYQTAIENAYLSSLLLTFDRFQFNVRYLGISGNEPTSSLNYLNTPSVRDDLQFNNRMGVRQILPTGGQWALELANNTLWMFSGDNNTNSSSVLSYSITQPLLLGAGRKIVLENLTQSERSVLYDIRTLARFRKTFFGNVVVNGAGGGFLGLLRQRQTVINQQGNIRALVVQVERLRELNSAPPYEKFAKLPANVVFPPDLQLKIEHDERRERLTWRGVMGEGERDRLSDLSDDLEWKQTINNLFLRAQAGVVTLDLAQLLTRLSSQENNLRDAERGYLDSLDLYKLTLGLPTDFQLSIDTSLLKQFELIDPSLNLLEDAIIGFKKELEPIDSRDPPLEDVRRSVTRMEELRQQVRTEGLDKVETDFKRVNAILPQRLASLTDLEDRRVVTQDLDRAKLVYQAVVLDVFSDITARLQNLEAAMAAPGVPLDDRVKAFRDIDNVREDLLQLAQSLRAIQAGLRSELITLNKFEMTQEAAVQLALENQLDLMNARGEVMDARRQMEVAANRLEAVLNVVARGDVGTSGGNKPFDFRGDRSTFQAGVQFTAPLDQVLERNAYRQSQINYQRARRAYMALEDDVKLDVRTEWRALVALKQNFETARQNLRIAALQLDSNIETLNQPVRAGQAQPQGNQQSNQGLNLINALQSVLNAQNELIRIWVQYEQNRINIHRDMDIMQVDERGIWIDPVYQSLSSLPAVSPTLSEPTDVNDPPAPGKLPDDRAQPVPPGPGFGAQFPSDDHGFVTPTVAVVEAADPARPAGRSGDGWRPRARATGAVSSAAHLPAAVPR
ncbi:MAG: TolC family protein [Planctomycetaceae bacterium]|nr:TolC family protein [Planctomycetaceae bacterium]